MGVVYVLCVYVCLDAAPRRCVGIYCRLGPCAAVLVRELPSLHPPIFGPI
jgi:hypothetical protein